MKALLLTVFSFFALPVLAQAAAEPQTFPTPAGPVKITPLNHASTLIEAGGTITHHHAVGRDHRPWYDRQRPELFATALRAAKRELDPQGVLNPGVLIDP